MITRHLLYLPVKLTFPKPARALVLPLRSRYQALRRFRHSPLSADDRWADSLTAFRIRRLEVWQRRMAEPPAVPHTRAKGGAVRMRPGTKQRWPHGRGVFQVRRSLLLFEGSEASVKVEVPAKATLTFQLGLVADGIGGEPLAFTCIFRDEQSARKSVKLFEHHLGARQAGRWLRFRVPLAAHAGRKGELAFRVRRVRPGPGRPIGAVALAVPSIVYPAARRRPNVILVVLDTVRPDALGCYGQKRTATPNVDAVAARGAQLANAFTNAPWTRPALMALFSSRTPGWAGSSAGYFSASFRNTNYLINGGVPTVFSHLARHGYLNRCFTNNVFMLPYQGVGHDHGLAEFDHMQVGRTRHRKDNEAITSAAELFLRVNRERHFFLHVLYESVHSPYRPPEYALRRMRKVLGTEPARRLRFLDHYRAEVMVLDDYVGRIVRALKKNRLWSNTILVITADHGETHAGHHCFTLPRMGYNTCYKHSATLYDEVLRVPLILAGGPVPAGRKVAQTYRHIDLVPTLLDLMQLPPLPGAHGRSVAGYLRGDKRAEEPRDVYAVGRGLSALRRGGYKLIVREKRAQSIVKRGTLRNVALELYDLKRDPEERRNLANRRADIRRKLLEVWKRYRLADRLPERFRTIRRRRKKPTVRPEDVRSRRGPPR